MDKGSQNNGQPDTDVQTIKEEVLYSSDGEDFPCAGEEEQYSHGRSSPEFVEVKHELSDTSGSEDRPNNGHGRSSPEFVEVKHELSDTSGSEDRPNSGHGRTSPEFPEVKHEVSDTNGSEDRPNSGHGRSSPEFVEVKHELSDTNGSEDRPNNGKEVRMKWKNLRDRVCGEMKKMCKPKSGIGAEEEESDNAQGERSVSEGAVAVLAGSNWPYFNSLKFLTDQFTPRENKGNLPTNSVDPATMDPEDVIFDEMLVSEGSSLTVVDGITKRTSRKRQSVTDVQNKLIEIEKKKLKLLAEEKDRPDELTGFFDSLLPHIGKLSDERKMLLMMEIQQIVYKHVYGSNSV